MAVAILVGLTIRKSGVQSPTQTVLYQYGVVRFQNFRSNPPKRRKVSPLFKPWTELSRVRERYSSLASFQPPQLSHFSQLAITAGRRSHAGAERIRSDLGFFVVSCLAISLFRLNTHVVYRTVSRYLRRTAIWTGCSDSKRYGIFPQSIVMFFFFRDFFLTHLLWKCAVVACQAVANIVKSSLGPVGLDKVLIAFIYPSRSRHILTWIRFLVRQQFILST